MDIKTQYRVIDELEEARQTIEDLRYDIRQLEAALDEALDDASRWRNAWHDSECGM